MFRRTKLALASCALALGLGLTTAAQAAEPTLALVELPAQRFQRSIETHKLELRYRETLAEARKLDAAPKHNLLAAGNRSERQLRRATGSLEDRVEEAKRREARAERFGLAAGVSQATLDAIAACESGGDPAVVDASGTYYGKYQFDTATWASVGGSGSPAQASEAEQDYRASLLYSRAGSSPWPVCG